MPELRLVLPAVFALLLAACAGSIGGDGLGGTGRLAGGDGLGGSGRHGGDDGLGGTGIVGAITGFGSIRLNGLEVATDASTEISVNGRGVGVEALQIGQIAQVLAGGPRDALRARSILVRDAVRGPARSLAPGRVEVLGQEIRAAEPERPLPRPGAGEWLAVQGLRHPQGWLAATYARVVPATGPVHLAGRVERAADGELRIGGQRLASTDAPPPGATIWVSGALRDGVLVVERLQVAPPRPFPGRISRLVVQGFARPDDGGFALHIGDWELAVAGGALAGLPAATTSPALVDIRVDAAGIDVERVITDRPVLADTPAPPADAPPRDALPQRPDAVSVDRPVVSDRPPAAIVRPEPPERPPTVTDRPPVVPERPEPPPVLERPTDMEPVPERPPVQDIEPLPDAAPPTPDAPTDRLTR